VKCKKILYNNKEGNIMKEDNKDKIIKYREEVVELILKWNKINSVTTCRIRESFGEILLNLFNLNEKFIKSYEYINKFKFTKEENKLESLVALGVLHLYTPIEEKELSPREELIIANAFTVPFPDIAQKIFNENPVLLDKKVLSSISKKSKYLNKQSKIYEKLLLKYTDLTELERQEAFDTIAKIETEEFLKTEEKKNRIKKITEEKEVALITDKRRKYIVKVRQQKIK